ncbi:MAG: hypothetical protein FWG30_09810 [Eubacteriaceae bacterium]|nr:hypothetical protein [Eubacteriaceae bacterium]
MIRQKNKLLALIFSIIPGAAHMYLGFQRKGVSIMAAMIAIFMASLAFDMPSLLMLVSLLWFYAFFDAMGLNSMPEGDFVKQRDAVFIETVFEDWANTKESFNALLSKGNKTFGFILSITGIALACKSLANGFLPLFIDERSRALIIIDSFIEVLPAIVASMLILALGFRLFFAKSKGSDETAETTLDIVETSDAAS